MKRWIELLAIAVTISTAGTSAAAMTLAKVQAVAAATTNAGFDTHAIPQVDGSWRARVRASSFSVSAAAVANLATAQGVAAFIAEAEFPALTKGQAQTIATAVTNAGFAAIASPNVDGTWRVRAQAGDFAITAAAAANLAASNGVTVFVAEAEFQ